MSRWIVTLRGNMETKITPTYIYALVYGLGLVYLLSKDITSVAIFALIWGGFGLIRRLIQFIWEELD